MTAPSHRFVAAWRDGSPKVRGAVLLLGLSIMMLTWAMSDAPFAAPDEWAHYVRAVGVGEGKVLGEEPTDPLPASTPQERWASQATRYIEIPAGLWATGLGCFAFQAEVSADCLDEAVENETEVSVATPVGTYQPVPYLLPGLAIRLVDSPIAGLYAGRLAMGLSALAMFGLAVWLLGSFPDPSYAIAGLLLAFTPMVAFTASSLNPSSLEIASGFALAAASIRLAFDEEPATSVWFAAAGSAALLAMARSITPLWLLGYAVLVVALRGLRSLWDTFRSGLPWSAVGAGVVVLALALNLGWESAFGPDVTVDLSPWRESLAQAAAYLPWIVRQHIGIFGYLDTSMPQWAYLVWYLLLFSVIVLALLVGTRRERFTLIGLLVTLGVLPVVLLAAVMRHTGFGVQARHIMALTVVIPILAGVIVATRAFRLGESVPRLLPAWVAIGTGAIHVVAWYTNARRYATGLDGPIWFAGRSEWAPPGGWAVWGVLLLVGIALTFFSVIVPASDETVIEGASPASVAERS
jgi:hypothetical protein